MKEVFPHPEGGPEIDQNPPFNAVTLAAMQEAEAIVTGKIRVEWQRPPATKEELKTQIRKMTEEAWPMLDFYSC
ncbi:MAG: hypothetical protein LBK08_11130 [Treponema sp.]|jgi:hypothetical protein|nr:hypothetical protein [Treponema sp.]